MDVFNVTSGLLWYVFDHDLSCLVVGPANSKGITVGTSREYLWSKKGNIITVKSCLLDTEGKNTVKIT